MKLSCTPISFRKQFVEGLMDIPRFIDTCARHGCQAIDLLTTHHYPWLWKDAKTQIPQIAGWLKQAGLTLAAHGCGNNFAAADPAEREQQIQKVQAGIEEAAELGAPAMRIFGGHIEPQRLEAGLGAHVGLPLVIEGIERCLPIAEKHGVVLALENHSNLPGHSYEIAAIIERFNTPWLRCLFDTANFMGNSMDEIEDPLRALDRLLPYIVHVHVKDVGPAITLPGRKAEAYVTGQGHTPVRQLVAVLEANGYAGCYSLEYEASFKVPEPEGVAASLAYLQNVGKIHRLLHTGQLVAR